MREVQIQHTDSIQIKEEHKKITFCKIQLLRLHFDNTR